MTQEYMDTGTLVLHHRQGDAVYLLARADLFLTNWDDVHELTLIAQAGELLPPNQDEMENSSPRLELSLLLDQFSPHELPGKRFEIPTSFEEDYQHRVARFSQVEPLNLNLNVVMVIAALENRFQISWTGVIPGKEEQPAIPVEIDATFTLRQVRDMPVKLKDFNRERLVEMTLVRLLVCCGGAVFASWLTRGWFSPWLAGGIGAIAGLVWAQAAWASWQRYREEIFRWE